MASRMLRTVPKTKIFAIVLQVFLKGEDEHNQKHGKKMRKLRDT